jgi:pyrimidine-specific ribonucleoside hydrolase
MRKFIIYCFFIFIILGQSAHSASASHELIIDTDVGIDDGIAILFLLQNPTIKIKAITIEGDGNAHCKPAYNNIKYLLDLVHQNKIPVACGQETPLYGNHHFPAAIMKQCDTFAGIFTQPNLPVPTLTASNLLIRTLQSSSRPVDILAIGPLTTLADVIKKHPQLKNKIHRIYIMGGAIKVSGNIAEVDFKSNNHAAEWNIYIDPYAAKKLFLSGIAITLIPLDVTNKAPINKLFFQRLANQQTTPASKFVFTILNRNKKMIEDKTWSFWDPLAAAIAVDESLGTIETFPLSVIEHPDSLAGATVINPKKGMPIQVCTDINIEKFHFFLLNTLANPAN